MFDRTLLPPAELEIVIISDTHYMLDLGSEPLEFESRRKQTPRAATAFATAAKLDVPLVFHLGDLVQEYPETPRFNQAMDEALAQIRASGLTLQQVAGNHDVGDKPDATMPTEPVTADSLAGYLERFGPSYYTVELSTVESGGCAFIVLNSQIMNSDLPAAAEQRVWLEEELEKQRGKRLFVLLHLPPYLFDRREKSLGHYENVAEPDRGWLLDLLQQHGVERLFAGHVHTTFYDRIGQVRYLVCNSTSFTRPGFCYQFTSGPLPERGRDDTPKMGFYLLRILPDRSDVHFLRTKGACRIEDVVAPQRQLLITRTSAGLQDSPLGLTARQALVTQHEVPLAWPGSIRERIRNDYPTLACLELGVQTLRVPWEDVVDSFQSKRLALLRAEGLQVVATHLWGDGTPIADYLNTYADAIDGWEVQLPGELYPSDAQWRELQTLIAATGRPCSLSPVMPNEQVPGKQHPRTRFGYRAEELAQLAAESQQAGVAISGVLCRVPWEVQPWDVALHLQNLMAEHETIAGWSVDLAVELPWVDDHRNSARAADALLAAALLGQGTLYLEPLLEMDRTMDTSHGLLDTFCNRRTAYEVVRSLNSLLFHSGRVHISGDSHTDGEITLRFLRSAAALDLLIAPQVPDGVIGPEGLQWIATRFAHPAAETEVMVYHLNDATSQRRTWADVKVLLERQAWHELILLRIQNA